MPTMPTVAARLCLFALVAVPLAAWAEKPTTTIYLQRGADGSAQFTDRPAPSTVVERTWQIERQDPVVARQRRDALDRETRTLSDRVQKEIDAREAREQQAEAADRDRQRLALAERREADFEADRSRFVDGWAVPPYGAYGSGWQPFRPYRGDGYRPQGERRDRADRRPDRRPPARSMTDDDATPSHPPSRR